MDKNDYDRIGPTEQQISEQFYTIDQLGRSGALADVSHFQNTMATLYQYPDISGATNAIVEAQQQLENIFRPIDLNVLDNVAIAMETLLQNLDTTIIYEAMNAMTCHMVSIIPNLINNYTNIALESLTQTIEVINTSQYHQTLVNQLSDVLDRVSNEFFRNALDYLAEEETDFVFSEEEFSVSETGGFILDDEEISMNKVMDYLEKMLSKQDEFLENGRKNEIDAKLSKRESRLQFLASLLLTIIF